MDPIVINCIREDNNLHQTRTGTNPVRIGPKTSRRLQLLEFSFAQHACIKLLLCSIKQSGNVFVVLVLVLPKGVKVGARDLATTDCSVG